ncbi:Fluconazole resistance protein 1 [Meyerozyma guilliermondii]
MYSHAEPSSPEDHDSQSHLKKKRVGKACDSCRIKKTKCDGKKPCGRCLADNKICVFSEKRRAKDKSPPSGYVELLETRLDLLTKSLEKMVQLSKNHLPFLKELYDPESDSIPINDVVTYLIKEKGLLASLPVEWEKGAIIAATMSSQSQKGIEAAASAFARHRREREDDEVSLADSHPIKTSISRESSLDDEQSLASFDTMGLEPRLGRQMLVNSAALGGIPSPQSSNSEYDLDNSSNHHPELPGSLFSNDLPPRNSSVTSLTNKLETHTIHSPTLTSSGSSLRRSSSLTRPYSPSHQKMKNHGHIQKNTHSHHHHSHAHNNIISNNGNEFSLALRASNSSPSLEPQSTTNYPSQLASQESKMPHSTTNGAPIDFTSLNSPYLDDDLPSNALNLESIDNLDGLVSNPFAKSYTFDINEPNDHSQLSYQAL